MPTTKATKEAAQALGVSVGTMRNWSDQFADYLSESARPGHQPERRFTDKDLTILRYIQALRGEGMRGEQIRERLGETTFSDVEIMQQQATTKAPNDIPSTAIQAVQDAPDSTPALMMALDIIETLQHRLEAIEQSKYNAATDLIETITRRLEAVEESQQVPNELPTVLAVVDQHDKRLAFLEMPPPVAEPPPLPSQRDSVTMFGVGFVAALLFVLVIVGIAVLYGGFK